MSAWQERFDKQFTRVNKSTGAFEEKWFVREAITAQEIKVFIQYELDRVHHEIKQECDSEPKEESP